MARVVRSIYFWIGVLIAALVAILIFTRDPSPAAQSITLSDFQNKLHDGQIKTARIDDGRDQVVGQLVGGKQYTVRYPDAYGGVLTEQLLDTVPTEAIHKSPSLLEELALQFIPGLLILGLFIFGLSMLGGGGGRIMQFGKAKPKVLSKDQPKVTFSDVAGADEAVEELHEIKEFLESPAKFQAIGAKIPKGVLLFGPPGTGKTLLARAVAGEAGVPFFSISGSDFVEMFVGVGASRVRDLFEQAKGSAPCIIFMDEIDAVGRHRGAGMGGGHDEREQTLNQLLVEMDGFDPRTGIILIAATNRPDILDPALLRPGRFDRQITVDRPDIEGRKKILSVHAADKPLTEDVDLEVLARRTPGFTGADLANLVNEAALITARHNGKQISMVELEDAIDRVIGGPERKSRVMSDEEKRVIAYHEGGHALVGHLLPDANPVHKVSIIARGRALGWTLSLPTEDRNIVTRKSMKAELAMALGGRVAEEVIFGEPSTGAANDIEKVSNMARAMVTQYGMSDELGPQQLGQTDSDSYLGRSSSTANYSAEVAAKIDSEVRKLVDEAHATATAIVTTHCDVLDNLANTLIEKETVDTTDLQAVWGHVPMWPEGAKVAVNGKKPSTRKPRPKAVKPPLEPVEVAPSEDGDL
jgi:cell division protease FtsH